MILKRCSFVLVLALSTLWSGSALAALTGEYLFEGNANDSSGLSRNGTITGGTFTDGLYMGSTSALLQTAAGQTVALPANTDFIRNAPGATLLAWVRADDVSATRNVVVVNNADATAAGGIGNARALLEFSVGNGFRAIGRQADSGGSTTVTGPTPLIGQTYFLAGVFDYVNGDLFLYIDGQVAASNTNITTWTANSADTANLAARIGSHADGAQQHWIGAIDGVRIFNEAMSATDILNIYNAETFPPPLPGDTDGDGTVEPEDLTPIRDNWRQVGQTRLQGNLSGDAAGLVDFADFRQWKTACLEDNCLGGGSLSGLDLGFLSVPEPDVTVLVLGGLLGLGGWRRSRGRTLQDPCGGC
jgi:hypothetical protein